MIPTVIVFEVDKPEILGPFVESKLFSYAFRSMIRGVKPGNSAVSSCIVHGMYSKELSIFTIMPSTVEEDSFQLVMLALRCCDVDSWDQYQFIIRRKRTVYSTLGCQCRLVRASMRWAYPENMSANALRKPAKCGHVQRELRRIPSLHAR